MNSNTNVVALPTKPDGEQGWQCTVCGGAMSYCQPINLRVAMQLLGAFLEKHTHETPNPTTPC